MNVNNCTIKRTYMPYWKLIDFNTLIAIEVLPWIKKVKNMHFSPIKMIALF